MRKLIRIYTSELKKKKLIFHPTQTFFQSVSLETLMEIRKKCNFFPIPVDYILAYTKSFSYYELINKYWENAMNIKKERCKNLKPGINGLTSYRLQLRIISASN